MVPDERAAHAAAARRGSAALALVLAIGAFGLATTATASVATSAAPRVFIVHGRRHERRGSLLKWLRLQPRRRDRRSERAPGQGHDRLRDPGRRPAPHRDPERAHARRSDGRRGDRRRDAAWLLSAISWSRSRSPLRSRSRELPVRAPRSAGSLSTAARRFTPACSSSIRVRTLSNAITSASTRVALSSEGRLRHRAPGPSRVSRPGTLSEETSSWVRATRRGSIFSGPPRLWSKETSSAPIEPATRLSRMARVGASAFSRRARTSFAATSSRASSKASGSRAPPARRATTTASKTTSSAPTSTARSRSRIGASESGLRVLQAVT